MSIPRLPEFPSASTVGATPLPARTTVNRTSRAINDSIRTVSADKKPLGPVYGRTRVGGKIDIVKEVGGYLYIRALFCLGTVHAIESITLNDTDYVAGNYEAYSSYQGDWSDSATWVAPHDFQYDASAGEIYKFNGIYYQLKENISIESNTGIFTPSGTGYRSYFTPLVANANVNIYRGVVGQGVDPIIAEAIAGYAETLTGQYFGTDYQICYATLKILRASYDQGFPRISAIIQGKEVHDYRSGLTVYTDNPSLCLADYIQSPLYGLSQPVNGDSVVDCANYNDELFADRKRTTINIEVAQVQDTSAWVETLRLYADLMVSKFDGEYHFICNSPRPTDHKIAFSSNDLSTVFEFKNLPTKSSIDLRDRPNFVRIYYTDTTLWNERSVEVKSLALEQGLATARVTEIRAPGCHSYEQALRLAKRFLNVAENETFRIIGDVFDAGIKILPGHVIEANTPNGLVNEKIRVLTTQQTGLGRYRISGQQYSEKSFEESL